MTSKTVIIDLSHCDSPVAAVEAVVPEPVAVAVVPEPVAVAVEAEQVEPEVPVEVKKEEPDVEGGEVSYPSYMGGSPRWPGSPRAYSYPSPTYAPSSPTYTPQVLRVEGGPLPPLTLERSAKPSSPMQTRTMRLRMLADSDEAKRRRELAAIDSEIAKLEEKRRRLGP